MFLFVCYIYCVFSSFRQFEERELRSQQERAKKRLEFENQKFRLQNQIEFERSRDTIGTHNGSKIILVFLVLTSDRLYTCILNNTQKNQNFKMTCQFKGRVDYLYLYIRFS